MVRLILGPTPQVTAQIRICKALCYRLNVCIPPSSYIETLIPNVMVLGGKASGRHLGHECGGLLNGISALIKDRRELAFLSLLSATCRYNEKMDICKPEGGSSPKT